MKVFNEDKIDNTLNHMRDFPEVVNKIIWINQVA